MFYICIAFAVIAPYLICGINPAIIAAKIKHGKDIREMGSGNPGLTNTLRTMGKSAAGIVLLFDVLKGVLSILLVSFLFKMLITSPNDYLAEMMSDYRAHAALNHIDEYIRDYNFKHNLCLWIGALFSVLGHCYPVYYKLKGGKAVLVTVATGLAINWLPALLALGIFILLVLLTKYVSLGSMIAATSYAILMGIFDGVIGGIFAGAIAALLVFKHKGNIKRLLNKTEKKIGQKSS